MHRGQRQFVRNDADGKASEEMISCNRQIMALSV